jgi:hypothetical protein
MRVVVAVLAALLLLAPPAGAAPKRTWLAGDLHVHTCYSHDAFCFGVDDPAEEPESLYTLSLGVGERFTEAAARGLDFLAITDHNDTRSVSDPGFGTAGVIGVPGYEASLNGHAQVLGARAVLPGDAFAVASAVRAAGGVLQANHPGYTPTAPFGSCAETEALDWEYGYSLQPDTIEAWNPTSPNDTALRYLECWLDRGARIGITGGSDSHWASIDAVQGPGNPTTWVQASGRSTEGVLEGLRAGRTTLTRVAPNQGGGRLVLQVWHAKRGWRMAIGREVAPGARMRARLTGGALAGFLDVRANGAYLAQRVPLAPGQPVEFAAPGPGWLRASLHALPGTLSDAPGCQPADQPASTCAEDHTTLALTSPVYVD